MLVSLHVKNMALIKEVEVEFGEGLNIMTGETGAGKSIVIGSVNIALGTGNFKDYVPEDADYALGELVFRTENPKRSCSGRICRLKITRSSSRGNTKGDGHRARSMARRCRSPLCASLRET